MVRSASFCTGVGGLDLGLTGAYGSDVETVWYAEVDPDACRVLAARLPGVRNVGDIKTVDWASLPPVELITAGFPCQPVSSAGQQKAHADDRWLWPHVLAAIRVLRPQEVVLENVRNLVSIQKGAVLAGILTELRDAGYAVRYAIAGACAVGSCHHRHRVFIVARLAWQLEAPPAQQIPMIACGAPRNRARLMLPTPTASSYGHNQGGASPDGPKRWSLNMAHKLFPSPTSSDGKGGPGCPGRSGGDNLRTAVLELADGPQAGQGYTPGSVYAERHRGVALDPATVAAAATDGHLLPTPRATDVGTPGRNAGPGFRPPLSQVIREQQAAAGDPVALLPTPCARDTRVGYEQPRDRVNGPTLNDAVQQNANQLLPTPRHTDAHNGSPNQHGGRGLSDLMLPSAVIGERYGRYAAAVELWQSVRGVPAPKPTMLNPKGQWRLDPRLPEWMLGYPPGWITDLVGRLPALRLAGNGVVPQVVAAVYPLIVAGWGYPQAGDPCPTDLDTPGPGTYAGPAAPGGPHRGALTAGPAPAAASPAAEQLTLV
jgi:DNA (cytosine-5)-methyltransferase 1